MVLVNLMVFWVEDEGGLFGDWRGEGRGDEGKKGIGVFGGYMTFRGEGQMLKYYSLKQLLHTKADEHKITSKRNINYPIYLIPLLSSLSPFSQK